jgi:hypothetical protein
MAEFQHQELMPKFTPIPGRNNISANPLLFKGKAEKFPVVTNFILYYLFLGE